MLDFEDVNKELANKLLDDNAILKCINAQDVLKKLKLCGCVNIEGHGLNPLRGSIVLEQIDLSIARKHKGQGIYPEPKISQAATVPILDSIISDDGFSLKYIQFPQKWRYIGTHNASGEIYPVIEWRRRYNQQLNHRGFGCSKCNRRMINALEWLNGICSTTMYAMSA